MKAILGRVADGIERFLDYATLLIFCVITGSIVIQVFARYVLNSPTAWSEELARFLMAALTMFGSAAVIRREGHIAVTVLVDRLSGPVLWTVNLVRDVLVIGMAGTIAWYGFGLAMIGRRQLSPGMEIPMAYPYAAIPIGAFFIGILLLLSRIAPRSGADGASRDAP
jgi:TRAP-type transport system small permease protein